MQGIESERKKEGYMLMVCNTDNQMEQQKKYLDLLQADSVGLDNAEAIQRGCQHLLDQRYESLFVVTQSLNIAPGIERVEVLRQFSIKNKGMNCEVFELQDSSEMLILALNKFIRENRGHKKAIFPSTL
ncbi:MAG: LacI family kdg operon repressor [Psychromonas sp.]|jgi:LacI family kdg operon repressor